MKKLQELFESVQSLSDFMKSDDNGDNSVESYFGSQNYTGDENISEGLKEVFNTLKTKFTKVWQYLKGLVVKVGTYWLPTDSEGNVLPAVSPLTAGQAYVDGIIKKNTTFVHLDKEGAKITGCRNKAKDVLKLYGSGNSLQYYQQMLHECMKNNDLTINEVKLQNTDPEAKYNVVDTQGLITIIEHQLKNKGNAPLLIWGAPGIGKTAIIEQVVKSLDDGDEWRFIAKTLANETADNFFLPAYVEGEAKKAIASEDLPKTWLPVYKPTGDAAKDAALSAALGKGLLFIDELSRATQQVLNVCLTLINEGRINEYKLGKDWIIIASSNRMEDEISGQSKLGNATTNRYLQVYFEPTVNTWRQWAEKQNFISPLLISWLNMGSGDMGGAKFFYLDPNEEYDNADATTLMCTPRAWSNVMRSLARWHHTGTLEGFNLLDLPENIVKMVLNMAIPASAVDSFWAFLSVVKRLGNLDEVVHDIWTKGGSKEGLSRKDLHLVSLPLAQLIIASHKDKLPTEKEFDNLCKWLVAQDSDQLTSYVLDVFQAVYLPKNTGKAAAAIFAVSRLFKTEYKDDATKEKQYTHLYDDFLKQWGLKIKTLPDWYVGFEKIINKYGEQFAVTIDGQDALG